MEGAKPNGSHTINITNAPAPDKHLVERPNNALKSLQSAAEAAEAPAAKDALNADFQRLLKENPDMKITTEDGREISLADLKKELGENDAIINAVRTCAI